MANLALRLRVAAVEIVSRLIYRPTPRTCHHKSTFHWLQLLHYPKILVQDLKHFLKLEIMAPHADDTTLDPKIPVPTKVLPTNGDAQVQKISDCSAKQPVAAVSNGEAKETRESTHHASPNPPLQLKGVLNDFKSFDVTPVIGREFPEAKLAEWLRASNSDELIKDLAITSLFIFHPAPGCRLTTAQLVSQRGVVFFRAQDGLDDTLQKELAQRLGELSGKPASSKLHIHPIINSGREGGGGDDEVSTISSRQAKKYYKDSFLVPAEKRQSGKEQWHSDITFENVRFPSSTLLDCNSSTLANDIRTPADSK